MLVEGQVHGLHCDYWEEKAVLVGLWLVTDAAGRSIQVWAEDRARAARTGIGRIFVEPVMGDLESMRLRRVGR